MFRCLAYHQSRSIYIEKLARELYVRWIMYCEKEKIRTIEIDFNNICRVEQCFDININIFSLNIDKSIKPIYKSRQKQNNGKETMYLNIFENHLSYITKFKSFVHKFKCKNCQKLFPYLCRLKQHERVCKNQKKMRLSGGYFKQKRDIFEQLEELGISVPLELRTYSYFSVFDLEAVLIPYEDDINENVERKLRKTSSHKPICVCICSNIPGFKNEKFIFQENLDKLLNDMITYLSKISQTCEKLAVERWQMVFNGFKRLEEK